RRDHQKDRSRAGEDGADQARIHPARGQREGASAVRLYTGHTTSWNMSGPRGSELSHDAIAVGVAGFPLGEVSRRLLQRTILIRQRRLLSRGSVASKKLKAL